MTPWIIVMVLVACIFGLTILVFDLRGKMIMLEGRFRANTELVNTIASVLTVVEGRTVLMPEDPPLDPGTVKTESSGMYGTSGSICYGFSLGDKKYIGMDKVLRMLMNYENLCLCKHIEEVRLEKIHR